MNEEQLAAAGANASCHVDFMVGSSQLDIDSKTTSGERVPVMRGGMWASATSGDR